MPRFSTAWELDSRNFLWGAIAVLGVLQFAAAVGYAIHVYPGGYDFANHFLSDLGSTRTAGGLDNAFCSTLFTGSIILLGLAISPFFLVLSSTLEDGRILATFAAVAACVGLIGIGVTPYDLYLVEHLTALGLWMLSTLLLMVTLFINTRLNRKASTLLGVISLGVLAAAWKYVAAGDHSGHVVFQKIFALACMSWLVIVFLVASLSRVGLRYAYRERQAELANSYLRQLAQGHRRPVNRADREA